MELYTDHRQKFFAVAPMMDWDESSKITNG